jgi:hypothetical protein
MPDDLRADPGGDEWVVSVTDRLESLVGAVRDKTTVPATTAARAVVFGVVVGTLGAVALLLLVVAGVRVLDVYLPFHPVARRVWVVDAVASAIFLGAGTFLWTKRRPRQR